MPNEIKKPAAEKQEAAKKAEPAVKPEVEKKAPAEKPTQTAAKPAEPAPVTPSTDKAGEQKADAPKKDAPAKDKEKAEQAEDKKAPAVKEAPAKAAERPPVRKEESQKPAAYAEGPTGTAITKVLGEHLNPPDEKAKRALPLPKDGEAFSAVLHPDYLKKAEFNHFSVDRDSDDFKELYKSIQMFGVKDPVLARPGKDGTLEIVSGQRRHLIAAELNYPVPTIIQRMDDDDARILVADGNLHRERISIYDQSRALRMKMDSMKRKSGRRKKGEGAAIKTDEIIATEMGISTAKLHRLMRLSDANREICDMIDDGKLTLSVASAISQLKPDHQTTLADLIDIGLKPSADQVERMRKAEQSGKLTEEAMRDIIDNKDIMKPISTPIPTPAPAPVHVLTPNPTPSMAPAPSSIPKSPDVPTPSTPAQNVAPSPAAPASAGSGMPAKAADADPFVGKQERPEETKVILRGDRLRKYFPDVNMTPREIEESVYAALEERRQRQEHQKQKDSIFKKPKIGPVK